MIFPETVPRILLFLGSFFVSGPSFPARATKGLNVRMCSARTDRSSLASPYNLPPRPARHYANAAVKPAVASYTALIFVVLVLVLLVVVAAVTFGLAPKSLLVVVLLVVGAVLVPLVFEAAVVVEFFAFFVLIFIPVVFFLALVVVVAGAFRLAPRVLLVVLYLLRFCLPLLFPVPFLPDFFCSCRNLWLRTGSRTAPRG